MLGMAILEGKQRPEEMAINHLDQRMQFVQLVFHRRAGEHEAARAVDPSHRLGGAGRPVLDALRLIEDEQIHPPLLDRRQITVQAIIGGHRPPLPFCNPCPLADLAQSANDRCRLAGEPFDLLGPLPDERCRGDEEDVLEAGLALQHARGGDGLRCLAQPHIVGEQGATAARQEEGSFALYWCRVMPRSRRASFGSLAPLG